MIIRSPVLRIIEFTRFHYIWRHFEHEKVISLILALCMILSLLTVSAIAAEPVRDGTAVSYVDENGDTRTCTDYTTASAAGTTWTGWIVVTEDTTTPCLWKAPPR